MNSQPTLTPPTDLREKLAQLLMVRIGSNLPPVRTVEEDESRIIKLLERVPVGGLILFNGRMPQTPRSPQATDTLARLQAVSKIPLLIGSDIE